MIKSFYSRIFYVCTIVLFFACALVGIVIMQRASSLHEQEARERFSLQSTALIGRIRSICLQAEDFPEEQLRTELEQHTLSYNFDSYLFDAEGDCLVRSDYQSAAMTLSETLREEANDEPYCEIGGESGNFSEPTAVYVERFALDTGEYYLMLNIPASYLSDFNAKLLWTLGLSVILVGALGAVLFYFNISRLLKPVLDVTNAVEAYAKGDFSVRLEPSGDKQLDYLSATLNRMADLIDRNERSRKSFVSDVSHELKTPITTIGGFVDSILDGTIPQNEERHYLEIVSSEVQRMSRLIHSMLNIAKFEEGTLKPNFKRFDITQLLIRTLLLFEQQADDKDLTVEGLELCPKTLVDADMDLMQQVFYNLTENAIKFVNKGGTLTISVESDAQQAHIHMRNTGEGLSKAEISRVFERFYKTDRSRGKDTTGVGLGLSIVSRIMILHGGTVTVKSVKGSYTEFIVSLPLRQTPEEETPKKEQKPSRRRNAKDKERT